MKKFQRTVEDFTCEQCGFFVKGTGYTNHCPSCLWSKHMDLNPGDRLNFCQGLMKPIAIEQRGGEVLIIQKCQSCRAQKKNKLEPVDNYDIILELS